MSVKEFTITLNTDEKLYVLGNKMGTTCLGFEVCKERSEAMAKWLNVEAPADSIFGTIEGYNKYSELVELCRTRFEQTKEKCPCELTKQLIGLEGQRVEIVDKWGEKRRFKVGRSTGWIPIHIELHNKRSTGGVAVLGAPFKSVKVIPQNK